MKKKPEEPPMLKTFTTRLSPEMFTALKVHAARTGASVQNIIADAVADYLKAHAREGK
jgi:predicted HicB family RNase H-like nuclease